MQMQPQMYDDPYGSYDYVPSPVPQPQPQPILETVKVDNDSSKGQGGNSLSFLDFGSATESQSDANEKVKAKSKKEKKTNKENPRKAGENNEGFAPLAIFGFGSGEKKKTEKEKEKGNEKEQKEEKRRERKEEKKRGGDGVKEDKSGSSLFSYLALFGLLVGAAFLMYVAYKRFFGGGNESGGGDFNFTPVENSNAPREGGGETSESPSPPPPSPVPTVPPFEPVFMPPMDTEKLEQVAGQKLKNDDTIVIEATNPDWDAPLRLMFFDENSRLPQFEKIEKGSKFQGNWKFRLNWLQTGLAVLRDPYNRVIGWNKADGRVNVFTEGEYDFSTQAKDEYYFEVTLREVEGGVEILPGGESSGLKVDNGSTSARSMDMLRAVSDPVYPVWTIKKI